MANTLDALDTSSTVMHLVTWEEFTRCPRDYARLIDDSSRSYQLAIAGALTDAYIAGVRTVVMPDGHARRLRSSEGRQELVVAHQAEQAGIEAYCAKIRDIRCAAERITERIAGTPTADDIVEFFGQWKALTGYGPRAGKQKLSRFSRARNKRSSHAYWLWPCSTAGKSAPRWIIRRTADTSRSCT